MEAPTPKRARMQELLDVDGVANCGTWLPVMDTPHGRMVLKGVLHLGALTSASTWGQPTHPGMGISFITGQDRLRWVTFLQLQAVTGGMVPLIGLDLKTQGTVELQSFHVRLRFLESTEALGAKAQHIAAASMGSHVSAEYRTLTTHSRAPVPNYPGTEVHPVLQRTRTDRLMMELSLVSPSRPPH